MAKLSDVRRRFPPEDPDVYAAAYAEAALADELGALLHALRDAAGLGADELAVRVGVEEDEVVRAEEGDVSTTIAYLDRVARAVGTSVSVTAAGGEVVLGAPTSPPPA